MPNWISTLGFIIAIGAAITASILKNWKVSLVALGLQYLGMSLLLASVLSVDSVIIKLLIGLMSCLVLWISCVKKYRDEPKVETNLFSSVLFRILATLLMVILVFLLRPGLQALPLLMVPSQIVTASLFLLLLGLLQLGMSNDPFFIITGLLTFYLGFETFYSIVETSSLLLGLLSIITMGIVLIGAYFLLKENQGEPE